MQKHYLFFVNNFKLPLSLKVYTLFIKKLISLKDFNFIKVYTITLKYAMLKSQNKLNIFLSKQKKNITPRILFKLEVFFCKKKEFFY